jgi:hypothetical protein
LLKAVSNIDLVLVVKPIQVLFLQLSEFIHILLVLHDEKAVDDVNLFYEFVNEFLHLLFRENKPLPILWVVLAHRPLNFVKRLCFLLCQIIRSVISFLL